MNFTEEDQKGAGQFAWLEGSREDCDYAGHVEHLNAARGLPWPGGPSRLRHGPDGARSREPQVSPHATVRHDLGCSRKSVRLLTFRSSARFWAELHERAFRRLGGTTRIVVLDNLREGVLVPDIYDPALNPLYRDVLAHYGAVAMPCRIQDPDRKGKVESGVGHAQKTPLKGLRFESLEEAPSLTCGSIPDLTVSTDKKR